MRLCLEQTLQQACSEVEEGVRVVLLPQVHKERLLPDIDQWLTALMYGDGCYPRIRHQDDLTHPAMIPERGHDHNVVQTTRRTFGEETGESACTTPVADATFHIQATELQA
ncbi:hypothetical protein GCM10010279_55560 [Streptomyces mutabilis]|nr:hypothetical protein GCM10010279_55560 [Streptomyces mutabilis]